MASPFPHHVTAIQAGSYFVGQYYQFLQQKPDFVYQFYSEASTAVRCDGTASETATGILQIHNLIVSLYFTEIEIKTAHSLESWNGGVLVMVSGLVQIKDYGARRKFMQTFFLAPQEKGYFVLNDIFHYLEEEELHQNPAETAARDNFQSNLTESSPMPEPVSDSTLREEIQARDYIAPFHVEDIDSVDKYSIQEPHQLSESNGIREEATAEEPAPLFPGSMNPLRDQPPAPVEEPLGEQPKHTYASILRIAKGQPVSNPTSLNKSTPEVSEWHHESQSESQNPQSNFTPGPDKSSGEVAEEFAVHEEEGDPTSVYLGNIPTSMTVSDLEYEFKNFGRLRPNGVSIRSRKETGIFYAFVEYEDAASVKNALEASPVQINGRQIHVEGRRPNSGAFRGRRGRGRGGYQSDAPRGRFGGRTFARGGSTQDGDYSSRRGNGYAQRGSFDWA